MKKRRRHISTGSKVFHETVEKRRRRSLKEIVFSKNGLFFFLLMFFAFSLNVIDLYWGLSGYITWQPDSIEGEIAVNQFPVMFHQWTHKYPRGQFLINWFFYYPLITHWVKNPITQQNSSGETVHTILNADRLRILASITRWINIVMRLGTIIAVFVLTKYLFGDYLAGWLAGFAMSIKLLANCRQRLRRKSTSQWRSKSPICETGSQRSP